MFYIHSGAYLQQSMGERQVASPSQGNTQTTKHTPKGNLESSVNLTGMSLDCERKPEYPMSTTHALGEHTNSMQKDRRPGVEHRSFLLQSNSDTNCATTQPHSKLVIF
ncbi:hypothetical protein CHARACLAT_031264 [Characodon lateralis]|uniref:Prolactin receptor n=1 Tax=Characodon lateralis TaxID=208331 RepID=A0ABU7CSU4_9TELE|nr:hypothetical protein [Characodon lateralis]